MWNGKCELVEEPDGKALEARGGASDPMCLHYLSPIVPNTSGMRAAPSYHRDIERLSPWYCISNFTRHNLEGLIVEVAPSFLTSDTTLATCITHGAKLYFRILGPVWPRFTAAICSHDK